MSTSSSGCYNGGIGFGTIVACYLSWMKWHSVGYAILHGILSWFYVLYYWLKYGF